MNVYFFILSLGSATLLMTENNIRGPQVAIFSTGKNTKLFKKFNDADIITKLIREDLCRENGQGTLYKLKIV